eukprot:TRINITY_DN27053_c0_g1_i1.p1 TRINITY_DN27053_c0_g1~~TRINITY_DN27053_c0_g1_i1.p1  ORF type:complete len:1412 (+),score=207.31 TRINITY_DN27053_c0_g1_i1:98-4333(+)
MWYRAVKLVFAGLAALGDIEAREIVIGVSLSLNSSNAMLQGPSREIEAGLLLLQGQVNDNRIFTDVRGNRLSFRFKILDDRGSSKLATKHYSDMVQSRSADIYLGPYSESIAQSVGEYLKGENYAQVLHSYGILEDTLPARSDGEPSAFAVSVQSKYLLSKSIAAMKAKGASSMSTIVFESEKSFIDMCDSAREEAVKLGYTVEDPLTFSDAKVALDKMHRVAAVNSDVLVLCAPLMHIQTLVQAASNVDLQSKAILASSTDSHTFFANVGPSLASYLLTADSWHRDIETPCKVFGSNSKFVQRYQAETGEAPEGYVASALAAAIALMEAVSRIAFQGTELEKQRELSASLYEISVPTLYGQVEFTPAGTPKTLVAKTFQLLPTKDFGVMTALIPDGNVTSMVWPMPDWSSKNPYLTACTSGYYPGINFRVPEINASDLKCLPCPPGKSTYGISDVCDNCDIGYYSKSPGSTCSACPPGADCQTSGIQVPNASKDHYLLTARPDKELLYAVCAPKSACLGNNTCEGQNAGTLCRSCQPGYTNTGLSRFRHRCSECMGTPALGGILLLYCLFNLWLGYICCDGQLSVSVHVVKRVISYSQLCAIAMQAGDLRVDAPTLGMLADIVVMPFQTVLGPDCLFASYPAPGASGAVDYDLLAESKVNFIRLFPLVWIAGTMGLTCVTCLAISVFKFTQQLGRRQRSSHEESFRGVIKKALFRSIRWNIFWMYVYYAPTTIMLVNGLQFMIVDNYRLRHYPDIIIKSLSSSVVDIVCLGTFSVVIPASVFYLLWKNRAKLEAERNLEIFGFLYSDFLPDFWYYEGMFFLFKFAFMLCLLLPLISSKLFFMLICLFVHTASFVHSLPFSKQYGAILEKLEFCCIMSLTFISILQNVFNWEGDKKRDGEFANAIGRIPDQGAVGMILYAAIWTCHAYFGGRCAIWFYRAIIYEPIRLKALAVEDSLNAVEMKIFKSMRVRELKWMADTQTLDITDVSYSQMPEFLSMLDTAMCAYIDHGSFFHPNYMIVALEEAIKTCIIDRRAKIVVDHPLILKQLQSKGVLGCLNFWCPWGSRWLEMLIPGEEIQDARALRLIRHSTLRALRKCSSTYATLHEFQDALQKQQTRIKHLVQSSQDPPMKVLDMPDFLQRSDANSDDAGHKNQQRTSVMDEAILCEMMEREHVLTQLDAQCAVKKAEANLFGESNLHGCDRDGDHLDTLILLDRLDLARLQAEASAHNLDARGTREELIKRLKASMPTEDLMKRLEASNRRFDSLDLAHLQAEASARNLHGGGTREELIERLKASTPTEDLIQRLQASNQRFDNLDLARLQAEALARNVDAGGTREELIKRLSASTLIQEKTEHLEARIPELMDEAAMLRVEVDRLKEEIWLAKEEDVLLQVVSEEEKSEDGFDPRQLLQ